MLDLNVGADSYSCEDDQIDNRNTVFNTVDADSVTSTTTNAEAFASGLTDELDSNSSTRTLYKFSILNEVDDKVNNGAITDRNHELQLFPVGALSSTPNRAKYWLNLSAPEVSGGAVVELGVFAAQLPQYNQVQVQQQQAAKKSRRGPRSRSSQYRGVTFYRRTGRWESHIWDCGKQVYLGGFDTAHAAARAYDRAAVKFRGIDADINFNIRDYEEDMKQMMNLTKEEFVQILRRQNTGFSRGSSKYRGVTLNKYGPWEARMGHFIGQKDNDQETTMHNSGQSIANFELCNRKAKTHVTPIDGGGNFDLDLGIALTSNDPQRNNLSYDGMKRKVESSSATIMTAQHAPMDGSIFSGFSPNSKERAMVTSGESSPFLEGQSDGVPLLSSSAASSGFSGTTIPYWKLHP